MNRISQMEMLKFKDKGLNRNGNPMILRISRKSRYTIISFTRLLIVKRISKTVKHKIIKYHKKNNQQACYNKSQIYDL